MNPDTLRGVAGATAHDDCEIDAAADAWEADIKDARVYERMANRNADVIAALSQRLEAARWLIETAPHCYGSMTREWETRRSAWLAALAAQARGEKP